MTQVIYNYPKSSCDCYNCGSKSYIENAKGFPTNLSVKNCTIPKSFDCYNNQLLEITKEPEDKKGYIYLNANVYKNKTAKDFEKVQNCSNYSCPKTQYISRDPRLISVPHSGQVITLDQPPLDSSVNLSQLPYDTNLDSYGQRYNTYSNINAGTIAYYINKEREDAFHSPNFVTPAIVEKSLYRDPMGAMKPQYNRKTTFCIPQEDNTLSWITDSQEHRQDLLSRQMRKRNEQRWEPRWT